MLHRGISITCFPDSFSFFLFSNIFSSQEVLGPGRIKIYLDDAEEKKNQIDSFRTQKAEGRRIVKIKYFYAS